MTVPRRDPWVVSKTFALAGVSNMVSGAITHPIDVVKVRMQVDTGRGPGRQYSGLLSGASRVSQGAVSLWEGVTIEGRKRWGIEF